MSAIVLPANPYISIFDFRLQFDLSDGTIKVDLSPSVISDPAGITGVAIKVKRPDSTTLDAGVVFTPGTINSIFTTPLPRVMNVYMWGLYEVTLTLTLAASSYINFKTQNLCAPNAKNPYSAEIPGTLQLTLDCARGTLLASGFCGYSYRQLSPVQESYNITHFYPPEAELLPQKNLSVVPFFVDAYVGLNTFKGVNYSVYDFTDNVFVILRVVATSEKNVRCGMDMESIYCGMKSLLDQMTACGSTDQQFGCAFGEINALLWTAQTGINENKDVEEEIARLEKLLGVDCRCKTCAGEKVGPVITSLCPQVRGALAVINLAMGDILLRDDEQIQVGSTVGLNEGATSFTFDGTGGKPDYRGWEITIERTQPGAIQIKNREFTWDKILGHYEMIIPFDRFMANEWFNVHFNPIKLSSGGSLFKDVALAIRSRGLKEAGDYVLVVSFDSTGIPAGSHVQICYRPFCDTSGNPPWTCMMVDAIGTVQTVSIPVSDASTYQVSLAVVMPDTSTCPPVIITAMGVCPEVIGINAG